jgi:hypothetical protein
VNGNQFGNNLATLCGWHCGHIAKDRTRADAQAQSQMVEYVMNRTEYLAITDSSNEYIQMAERRSKPGFLADDAMNGERIGTLMINHTTPLVHASDGDVA